MTSNAPNDPVRVYLDSCCIIAFLLGERPTSEAVHALLEQAKGGKLEVVVTAAVLSEVRRRDNYDKAAAEQVDDLLLTARPGILRRPISIAVGQIAREIGPKYGLTPMDALHLASAFHERAAVFYTTDGDEPRKADGTGLPTRRKPKALLALNGVEIEWYDAIVNFIQIRRIRIEAPKLWTSDNAPLLAGVQPHGLPEPPPAPPPPDPSSSLIDANPQDEELIDAEEAKSGTPTDTRASDGRGGASGPPQGGSVEAPKPEAGPRAEGGESATPARSGDAPEAGLEDRPPEVAGPRADPPDESGGLASGQSRR